jgi:hypothetical protein
MMHVLLNAGVALTFPSLQVYSSQMASITWFWRK